jgi:hypothetical protein
VIKRKAGRDEKEQAFIAAARQELAARKPTAPLPARPVPAASTTSLKGSTVLGWDHPAAQPARRGPTAPTTPVDTPTVDGWDHPSARDTAPKVKIAAEEKWARVAAAMEAEQRQARQARARMRRIARRCAIGATVVILLAIVGFLHR